LVLALMTCVQCRKPPAARNSIVTNKVRRGFRESAVDPDVHS